MKLPTFGTGLLALVTVVSLSGIAAAECKRETKAVGQGQTIICGSAGNPSARALYRGDVGARTVQVQLLQGTQADVVGVTPSGKLVAAFCSARSRSVAEGLVRSRAVCIPKPGETYSHVLAVLFDD